MHFVLIVLRDALFATERLDLSPKCHLVLGQNLPALFYIKMVCSCHNVLNVVWVNKSWIVTVEIRMNKDDRFEAELEVS